MTGQSLHRARSTRGQQQANGAESGGGEPVAEELDATHPARLRLRISSADGLQRGSFGDREPEAFARAEVFAVRANGTLGSVVWQCETKALDNTFTPVWNELFVMPGLDLLHTRLRLTVWDDDGDGESDFVGRTELDLRKVSDVGRRPYRTAAAPLEPKGTISFELADMPKAAALTELRLRICSAADLKASEGWFGDSKPEAFVHAEVFYVFENGTLSNVVWECKTRALQETLTPVWDEVFLVPGLDLQRTRLRLTVWDEDDDGKDNFVGRTELDLHRVSDAARRPYRAMAVPLAPKGSISFELADAPTAMSTGEVAAVTQMLSGAWEGVTSPEEGEATLWDDTNLTWKLDGNTWMGTVDGDGVSLRGKETIAFDIEGRFEWDSRSLVFTKRHRGSAKLTDRCCVA